MGGSSLFHMVEPSILKALAPLLTSSKLSVLVLWVSSLPCSLIRS